uniref:Golgi associated, gamma adaptin ear containing, ARF binding protein 1 n=1 Tax=Denticeps clupeoides TaxID=299321 RepID=A0AAY4ACU8_9TELE
QEWEAMQALMVLETCMKSCGKRFHNEVGKFRFLNELIKVVSPKYLGSRAPEPVKKKVLEVMYSWTVWLPEETKISDAYQMLKKQGIVKQDPVLPDDKPLPPPPPRPKNAIFEDEEKSKMLSRLLNSTHPEDLKAANKLIKEMVQEDQKRMEKVSKRVNAIQEVKESVKLLTQLLGDYCKETSSQSNEELIKDLYQRCEKMRPTLFRLASDTEDNDEALAEILQANDSLTQVINLYRHLVKGEEVNGDSSTMPQMKGQSAPHQRSLLPVTIFDKHSLRVLFHFAKDCPPARPDVLVVIISMLSSAPIPVTNIRFQAAVPKTMKVKLQPSSGTDLPACNPILPPAAITQVLLLANPHKVSIFFCLTFDLGEESHDESGDLEEFPSPDSWGNL